MISLKDLKRSLALTLCSVLVLSGVDTTVFADEGEDVPKITATLDVGVSFFDRCTGYNRYGTHNDNDCSYSLVKETNYRDEVIYNQGHFGATFTKNLTVPINFSDLDNLSNYSVNNITSIVVTDETCGKSVEYDKTNLKAYLPFGYYSLVNFDYTLLELFDICLPVDINKSSKESINNFLEKFDDDEFTLTFNYNINGRDLSTTPVELILQSYTYTHDGGTGIVSISDIVKNIKLDSGDASQYEMNTSTGTTNVLSVPTSKTVVNSDFYKDNNAIFNVIEGDNYNTYYVDINSNYNIDIPLNDMSYGASVTKVLLDDKKVYDTSKSIMLNSDNDTDLDYSKDEKFSYAVKPNYIVYDYQIDLQTSDNIGKYFKKFFKSSEVLYNDKILDFEEIDYNTIDMDDFLANAKVYYAKTNTGLLNSDKYIMNYEKDYDVPILHESYYDYITEIYLDSWLNIDNLPDLSIDGRYNKTYLSDEYSCSYYNYYPVYYFYSRKNNSFLGNYNEAKWGTSVFKRDYLDSLSKNQASCFIKLPNSEKTSELFDDLYKDSNHQDFTTEIQPYFSSSRDYKSTYTGTYGFFRDSNLYNTSYIDSEYHRYNNSYYIKVNTSINGMKDFIVNTINNYYNETFNSFDEVINSKFGVPCYSIQLPNNILDDDLNDYKNKVNSALSTDKYVVNASSFYESNGISYIEVPCFLIDMFAGYDSSFSYISSYFEDNLESVYKYTAKSYLNSCTFNILGLSKEDYFGMNTYSKMQYYSNTSYLSNLSDLNGKDFHYIRLYSPVNDFNKNKASYLKTVEDLVDILESAGASIDYKSSNMPDFNSGTLTLGDYMSIDKLDSTMIKLAQKNYDSYGNYLSTDYYFGMGCDASPVNSISTGSHVYTDSKCTSSKLSVSNNLFNTSDDNFEKGYNYPIYMQVLTEDICLDTVKNIGKANNAKLFNGTTLTDNLVDNSDLFAHDEYNNGFFGAYFDYKFGNIIFASKPSAPLSLTLDGDKLTWVKPIDEGLGYTANNTRSRKMSIRSVSPSFTSKTDDVVHLESYTLEIKDSSDVVKYTQTLTDSGSGLEEEITIPSQYLTSEYTAYIYATNKIGASDSASINLGVPSAKVTVSTDKESYKVGDTIIYTETIKNTSSSNDLTNVKVTQSLIGGTYEDQTGVTTTDNVATIPTLGKGDSVTLTYKYVVPAGVVSGDIISNKVTVTSDEGVNTYIIKEVTIADGIKDLSLDVTTDKSSYKPGDTVILKSSVKNTGEVDLTNVKITQQLDGEYIPKSGVIMSGKDASILTLAVGETVEVEYKIIIPSNYNQTSMSNKTDVTADGGVDKSVTKTITIVLPTPTDRPYIPPVVVPTPKPTEAPTAEPTKVPTEAPTQEPTQAPTEAPTEAPTQEPTQVPTQVPEYDFTIKDVYHNDDGTVEVKERENVCIKEGEPYSFSALDSDDYIPRVPKYEGIASKDTEIIFDYDEKEKRVTLQGYVTYSDGSPIKDKLIEVSGKENKSDITDDTGFYRIDNILVGDYDYTLYNDVTTGSGILAKCGITVTKKSGTVEVKYNSDDCKVDYTTEDGVIRVNANIKKEEVATPSPVPTIEPTLAPTQEPTVAPTVEPTIKPTVKPTKKPTPVSTKKPNSTPKPTKKPAVVPIKVSTPEPTRKPTRVTYLAQTGIYDIKKVASAGVLILSGIGLVIIALRRRKK